MSFETIGKSLVNQSVSICQEQDVLGLLGPEKEINQRHRSASFPGAGCHHDQSTSLAGGEGLSHATDCFVLIWTIDDRRIDRSCRERLLVIADESKAFEIGKREESAHESRIRLPNRPEVGLVAIGHKAEGFEVLTLCDFSYVVV